AFSGQVVEYELAYNFFTRIKELIQNQLSSLIIKFVIVPGNHDCDFTKEDRLRTLTLKSGEQILEQLDPSDDSIVRALVGVQDNFFNFLAKLEGNQSEAISTDTSHAEETNINVVAEGYDRLHYSREFEIDQKRI